MKVSRPLVIDNTEIASEALALLTTLREKLSATTALQDVQRREAHTHVRMPDWWFSHSSAGNETPIGLRDADRPALSAQINWRWKLWAAPHETVHADAFELVQEAADRLARFLPAEELAGATSPASRTSGPSAGR